jgi:phosphatidylserine/phosphatidylglycerophosphate/cardiolipin synthase-like enzyme
VDQQHGVPTPYELHNALRLICTYIAVAATYPPTFLDTKKMTSDGSLGNSLVVQQWLNEMRDHASTTRQRDRNQFSSRPESLITQSNIQSLTLSTGEDILHHLRPAIESAQREIIFVTCFWAHSESLETLKSALETLSTLRAGRQKVRVRIGFSSLSLSQKLFQTSSLDGKTYASKEWPIKLGLPPADELPGLDIQVKSIFVRPFSIMHPKFVIIDRKEVWLPSCNVSWESWFEGCVRFSGPVVQNFVAFWQRFWGRNESTLGMEPHSSITDEYTTSGDHQIPKSGPAHVFRTLAITSTPSVFLPSPHHINPRFMPFSWTIPTPPPTPLNVFLLTLFDLATHKIYIQTPNITSAPVLKALLSALQRGVHVNIVTSERLMILEQLFTAGTTTAQCVKKMAKKHKRMKERSRNNDEEAGLRRAGNLVIEYFQPKRPITSGEPLKSHLKLTIVDEEWVVLGSGNMDRASWYTSQELDVAFRDQRFAQTVKDSLDLVLHERKRIAFNY